ncbi:MAG: NUDIX hydrolase [Streptosporangiales bacterium]
MRGDGDGWVACAQEHQHWGRYGAAGLLVRDRDHTECRVLLQLRVEWSHHGGTWGVPGGARDSDETAVQTALREAAEEAGVVPDAVRLAGATRDDHGGWSYTTVLADVREPFHAKATGRESDEVRWVAEGQIDALTLHPGFAESWPLLRGTPHAPVVVVDAANVVGSTPDGWWRDRLGAARRLRDRLTALTERGIPAAAMPAYEPGAPSVPTWYPQVLLVVEGAARRLAAEPSPASVEVVAATRSGDDEIVRQVAAPVAEGCAAVVVVTADRELRTRCQRADARVQITGPRWLMELMP